MSTVLLILTGLCALLEWAAVYRGWRRLEYVAKPGVMLFLLAWLWWVSRLSGPLAWFGLGAAFSLVGDVFLLLRNEKRWFLFGLGAFLLGHLAYIVGLNLPPASINTITFGLAVLVTITAFPLIQRILRGLREKGLHRLVEPVRYYSAILALMLFSALVTLFRPDWRIGPAIVTLFGAALFVTSDMVLAWNKFVHPIHRGRLLLMITYHLGQIALVVGAAAQFGQG